MSLSLQISCSLPHVPSHVMCFLSTALMSTPLQTDVATTASVVIVVVVVIILVVIVVGCCHFCSHLQDQEEEAKVNSN